MMDENVEMSFIEQFFIKVLRLHSFSPEKIANCLLKLFIFGPRLIVFSFSTVVEICMFIIKFVL